MMLQQKIMSVLFEMMFMWRYAVLFTSLDIRYNIIKLFSKIR
jgi:hypothetical protein